MRGSFLALALLVVPEIVRAAPPDDEAVRRARIHFQAGSDFYRDKKYEEALHAFEVSYQLAPRPKMLLNLGETERALGHLARALDYYRQYLTLVAEGDATVAQVQGVIADLERELAAQPPPAPPTVVELPVPVVTVVVPPRPEKRRRPRWVWGVVGGVLGAAVVVTVGVAAGLAARPHDPLATFGKGNGN